MEESEQDSWTVRRALTWTEGYLARKSDENPRLSARWLMEHATGLTRLQLLMDPNRVLSLAELDALHGFVARRGTGEPLQYIVGEAAFRHITVKVRPGVLIPRPETEVLVSEALALLPRPARPRGLDDDLIGALAAQADTVESDHGDAAYSEAVKSAIYAARAALDAREEGARALLVADICTGSGCIACSIASEHPDTRVLASDVSPEAVALARENVEALGLGERVAVRQGDLGEPFVRFEGRIDLVVSNPPYIPAPVLAKLPREVSAFEPALALDGGADGLDVYRHLLAWCHRALAPGGAFAFELHETCLDEAAELARAAGFSDVRIVADLAGRPRVLTARRGES